MADQDPKTNEAVRPQTNPALGPMVAEPAPETTPAGSGLPPGTHPLDPSIPLNQNPADVDTGGIGRDEPGEKFSRGSKPWGTKNENAFPVYQRAATDWDCGVVVANAGTNGGTATVVGRQKGRLSVKLWVPLTLPNGTTPLPVLFGPNESELQTPGNNAPVLNVGDSVVLETEGSVYIGCVGANLTGSAQYAVLFNPAGGGAGGD